MNIKTFAAASAIAAVLVPSMASANELYVTGSVGQSDLDHQIQRDLGENPPMLPVGDAGGSSFASDTAGSYQLAAGYEFDLADSPMFVAIEGFYAIETADTRNINGVLVTDVDLDARYGGRALFGYDVTDDFAVYTHGGVEWIDYDVTNSYTFAPPVTERSDTESAFSYGVGMRYDLSDNIAVVVDYTQVSDVDFAGIPEVAGDTGRENPNRLSLSRLSSGIRLSF